MTKHGEYIGPIYGVELFKELPIGRGLMRQAMPSRKDLLSAQMRSERTVAGYEVLTAHYRAALEEITRLHDTISELRKAEMQRRYEEQKQ